MVTRALVRKCSISHSLVSLIEIINFIRREVFYPMEAKSSMRRERKVRHCVLSKAVDFAVLEQQLLPCLWLHLLDLNMARGSGAFSRYFCISLAVMCEFAG